MRSAIYILIISFALIQCSAITGDDDDEGPSAQEFEHTVTVTDADNSIDLIFGMASDATDGFDEGLDQELPPPPPSGSFYGQFNISDYALSTDYKSVTADTKSWELEFAPAEGNTITLNWDFSDSNHEGSLTLVDDPDNPSFEVDMKSENSYSPSENTSTLYIVSNI